MKKDKKKIYIFIAVILFVTSQIMPRTVTDLDEIWNFNFARCISNGLIPYKDFNLIQGPMLPAICAIFLKVFGQELIVMRFLAIALNSAILIMAYEVMEKIKVEDYIKYIILIISAIIMNKYFTIDYNWATLLMTLIIIYMELGKEKSVKKEILLGIIAGITITLKQTTGLIICIALLGWQIMMIRNKEDFKRYVKSMLLRLLEISIVIFIFIMTLILLGAFNQYIDYGILGIKTFSNKTSYIDKLIKNTNILIKVLSIVPIFVYIFLICIYMKKNKKEALVLFTYSIAEISVLYPISDETHFVVGITPTLISIGFILNLLKSETRSKNKIEIFLEIFMKTAVLVYSVFILLYSIYSYKTKNINYDLEHFKYLPMSQEQIEKIKTVDDYIIQKSEKVYILDSTAALYMIPIDRYNKDYDMFLKGNLGSKGEQGQIEKLERLDNALILIKNSKHKRNWQTPKEVIKYIEKNKEMIGNIGVFDIYK